MKTVYINVTGHRPGHYGISYDWDNTHNKKIRLTIMSTLETLIKKKPDYKFHLINGAALGIDTFFGYVCKELREKYPDRIIIETAVPFEDQYIKWYNFKDIARYKSLLNFSDIVTYVDTLDDYKVKGVETGKFHNVKLLNRNKYMIDKSSITIAVFVSSKPKGGTKHAYEQAKKKGNKIILIDPESLKVIVEG